MAVETTPRSRRAILAAGLGGLAATVASSLGRNPAPARAANGDPLVLGQLNTASGQTQLEGGTGYALGGKSNTLGGAGLAGTSGIGTGVIGVGSSHTVPSPVRTGVAGYCDQDSSSRGVYGNSVPGTGVQGESSTGKGIYGKSTSSTGVRGQSDSGIGVWGTSLTNRAIFGTTGAANLPAIGGQNTSGKAGVHGYGGTGNPPAPIAETGVEGVCNISAQANGVAGRSTVGAGVWGSTTSGLGVIGTADGDPGGNGVGLYGFGPIGLLAESPAGGLAAQFAGPTVFTLSGKTTISSGSTKIVAIPDGLRPSSLVLAVLHTNRSGVWVRAVVPNVAAGTATIYLNTSVSSSTAIAWFVVN